jgi:hypothetical protein
MACAVKSMSHGRHAENEGWRVMRCIGILAKSCTADARLDTTIETGMA